MRIKEIRFNQPKYVIPALVYVFGLFIGWMVIDMFHTEIEDKETGLETTEYLNTNLPQANIKDDGIGNRYDNMKKSFGAVKDFSAVENIERYEEGTLEKFQSRYSDDERDRIAEDAAARSAELDRLREMSEAIEQGAEKGRGLYSEGETTPQTEDQRLAASKARQDSAMAELTRVLNESRQTGRQKVVDARDTIALAAENAVKNKDNVNADAVHSIDEEEEATEVVKVLTQQNSYFNTIADNDPQPKMIKAIIDEDITAVNGSRVRLRLLDDIQIGEVTMKKGSYLYATMSGFGSQRVKGTVQSILANDELVKVSLTLYDTDGLEGLYVPQSKFRETAKNVGSGAMSGSMSFSQGGSSGDMLKQWGMNALNNAYQKTTNAIGNAVKQNKAKLKYGTQVYLINSKEKRQ